MSKMKTDSKVVFSAEGYTNDLLQISEAHNMKRTSLVYFNHISKEIGDEVITVSIDSNNETLTFPIFDKMINKKIRVTVETIDDNVSTNDDNSKDCVNASTEIDDDDFVDLGLSSGTKWMKYNIGAEKETDCGLYFQWGDTVGYDKDSAAVHSLMDTCYRYGNYTTWNTANLTNNALTAGRDAAYVHTNGKAKMPSQTQIQELIDETDSVWTTIDGVRGRKFTSKKDTSKYIFIPAAGCFSDGYNSYDGLYGYVWSGSPRLSFGGGVYILLFGGSSVYTSSRRRDSAFNVRGVLG